MPAPATTPSAAYPYPLPDAGIRATEWALNVMHGARKSDAWITTVIDITLGSEWLGNHYVTESGALSHRSNAGHYVCIAVLKPGSTKRTTENVEAVAGLIFDDVGDVALPSTKMDIGWFADKPVPTFIVETSNKNFQYFYVFDEPAAPDFYAEFVEALKANEETSGGIKNGATLTRYVRLPSGQNPKAEKGGFKTRLVDGSGIKYSLGQLEDAFGAGPDNTSIDLDDLDAGISPPTAAAGSAGRSSAAASNPGLVETSPPVAAAARSRVRATPAASGGEELRLPEDEALALVEEILGLIRNKGIGREDWIGIIFGAWVACGRNDLIQDAVDRFTDKWEDGTAKPDADRKSVWDTRASVSKAGVTTLIRWLERQNTPEATAMRDRIKQIQAPGVFPLPPPGDNSGDKNSYGGVEAAAGPDPKPAAPILDWEASKRGRVRSIQPTIYPGIDRGLLTVVGGSSGALKSTYLMHAAVAIVAERADIINEAKIDFCGDVLVFANEDPEEIIDKRLDAIIGRHGVKNLKHKLFVQSGQMFEKTAKGKFVWIAEAEATITAIVLQVRAAGRQLALIAIDTLSSTAAGNDETNREMQEIANLVDDLVKRVGCAGLFVHHWRKMGTGDKNETDPNQDALRGGGAFGNTVRNILFMSKPIRKDRDAAGWKEDEAKLYVKVWIEKRSYGPTTQDDPAWFKKEKVAVPVVDPRDGSLHIEDYLVLIPDTIDKVVQRTGVLRSAHTKILGANARGEELVQMRQANNSPRSVQSLLDVSDAEANKIIGELLERKWIEIVDGKGKKERKNEKHVVALGIPQFETIEDEEDDDDEETDSGI